MHARVSSCVLAWSLHWDVKYITLFSLTTVQHDSLHADKAMGKADICQEKFFGSSRKPRTMCWNFDKYLLWSTLEI